MQQAQDNERLGEDPKHSHKARTTTTGQPQTLNPELKPRKQTPNPELGSEAKQAKPKQAKPHRKRKQAKPHRKPKQAKARKPHTPTQTNQAEAKETKQAKPSGAA